MKKKILSLIIAAVVIIPTSLIGCGSKSEDADIVIIGAGGAGLSAAVQAKQDGAKNVVVLEKMPMVGGNTNRATGGLNAAETKQQEAKNIEDSVEVMINDTMKGGYEKNNPELVDMVEIQTHPTVVPEKAVMVTEAVRGNGAILINKDGKRFTNELLTRDVVSEKILGQKDGVAYLFFDEGLRKSLKATEEYFNMGLVTEGDTIEELAEKLSIDGNTMSETVKKYNSSVVAKSDSEFQRDDLPRELNEGKVYAILVTPAVHHTMGGLKINTNSEVLNAENNVIPGLFAAGEVTGGVHGGNRLGGNALSDIVTFGRTAGKNAAEFIK